MDQDVINVKPVPRDKPNFLVSEGNNHFLTSAVLKLEKQHPILDIILPRLVMKTLSFQSLKFNRNDIYLKNKTLAGMLILWKKKSFRCFLAP